MIIRKFKPQSSGTSERTDLLPLVCLTMLEYLRTSNGFSTRQEVFKPLLQSEYLIVAMRFLVGTPILFPLNPMSGIVAPKHDPAGFLPLVAPSEWEAPCLLSIHWEHQVGTYPLPVRWSARIHLATDPVLNRTDHDCSSPSTLFVIMKSQLKSTIGLCSTTSGGATDLTSGRANSIFRKSTSDSKNIELTRLLWSSGKDKRKL